jgi:hypothetical protein
VQVDLEGVLGVASTERGRRLDLAHDVRVGVFESVQQSARAVGAVAVDREALDGLLVVDVVFWRVCAGPLVARLVGRRRLAGGQVVSEQIVGRAGDADVARRDRRGRDQLAVGIDCDMPLVAVKAPCGGLVTMPRWLVSFGFRPTIKSCLRV